MSMKDLLFHYLDGQITAIHAIRVLSGMFNPDHAIDILTIICQITRVEEGDLDKETFKAMFKL